MSTTTLTTRREQVRVGRTRTEDRFISITQHRLLATDVFVVGVVDGTGQLADPRSLLATTDPNKARRHGNRLYDQWGGETVEPNYEDHIPRRRRRRSHRIIAIFPPEHPLKRRKDGKDWIVNWEVEGRANLHGRRFNTEQEAWDFHAELTERKENH